jgi:hypothetical protein
MPNRSRSTTPTPWVYLALVGSAVLAAVSIWETHRFDTLPIVRRALPTLVLIPTVTFGLLALVRPFRKTFSPIALKAQTRWFWTMWAIAIAGAFVWLAQRSGSIFLDMAGLSALLLGAGGAVALYSGLRERAFS